EVMDWNLSGTAEDNAQHHDIAALVLAQGITIPTYAKIDAGYCGGCRVVQVGRGSGGGSRTIEESAAVRRASRSTKSDPFALTITGGARGPGAALIRRDSKGRPFVAGVMSGRGVTSGKAYAAITSSDVAEEWFREVIAGARAESPAKASSTT